MAATANGETAGGRVCGRSKQKSAKTERPVLQAPYLQVLRKASARGCDSGLGQGLAPVAWRRRKYQNCPSQIREAQVEN